MELLLAPKETPWVFFLQQIFPFFFLFFFYCSSLSSQSMVFVVGKNHVEVFLVLKEARWDSILQNSSFSSSSRSFSPLLLMCNVHCKKTHCASLPHWTMAFVVEWHLVSFSSVKRSLPCFFWKFLDIPSSTFSFFPISNMFVSYGNFQPPQLKLRTITYHLIRQSKQCKTK